MANSSPAKPVSFLYSALDNYGGYPFSELFDAVVPVYMPHDIFSENGCLILWGGEDISPSIYGQRPGTRTSAGKEISSRDQLELNLAGEAIKNGIPIIGVCRGAQMLCAMAGGHLVQHVDGHTRDHSIKTDDGRTIKTTSLHHQMMFPWETDHKLIAWSAPPISKQYLGEAIDANQVKKGESLDSTVVFPDAVDPEKREPEIVYFPGLKALCIQGHPEFIHNEKHEFVQYCLALTKQYLIQPFLKAA